jgi:hypothetical protein
MNIKIEFVDRGKFDQVILMIAGKPSLAEARAEIIKTIQNNDVYGPREGPWTIEDDGVIEFESDEGGYTITDDMIQQAITANGKEVLV